MVRKRYTSHAGSHESIERNMNTVLQNPPVHACLPASPITANFVHAPLYERLAHYLPTAQEREEAADFLQGVLDEVATADNDLPEAPEDLLDWMTANTENVHVQYQAYLVERKAGAPRRYFSNRAHALYCLRNIAPTKLVDGSWLYGICAHSANSRMSDLVRTYVEELGEGMADKNHVKLYRELLAKYGLDPIDDLADELYRQGLVQLALGWNAQRFLPEVIGFNLSYEQLPLHLLITAYELNELGLDPYYFTLHVTVDNADTGHARRACNAVLENAPRIEDGEDYWQRVRAGARLANTGLGTLDVIRSFDIESEVVRILSRKSPAGQGVHSDFCKVAGRSVNDWLSQPEDIPAFLAALEQGNWIRRNRPVQESRFWELLQGERAEMFGVFSPYELQVIHDWIRGPASADGASYEVPTAAGKQPRPVSFRVAERLKQAKGKQSNFGRDAQALDTDLVLFEQRYPTLDAQAKRELLVHAMAPGLHWTPTGLLATRLFLSQQ